MGAVKFSKQNTKPNPIEIDYWVDIKADPYGSIWKYFNGDNWVTLKLGEGNSGLSPFDYYTKQQVNDLIKDKATISSVESKVDDDELADVIKNVSFSSSKDGGVTVTIFKYDDTTVAIPLPIASSTISGIVTSKDFEDFVKQHQLQSLYSEMYDKLAEIREKYQPRLKAGKNIQIDRVTNTIHATGKISTDWYDITNAPDFALQSDLENEIERATNTDKILDTKIASHVTTVETSLDLKADKADTYTKDQIDSKLSGVYRIKGSCLFEQLPTNAIIGDTWNILNDFTLDGEEHPFGTNVVYTENGWDALAGIFDSSELEGDISGVSEALAQESIRAAKAEQANAESIQSETNRAIARENAIDAAYKAADTILQNNINIVDSKLVNYLPLTGGEVSGEILTNHLFVNNANGTIRLGYTSVGQVGYLAYKGDANWYVTDNGYAHAYSVIHSGNIGSQSVSYASNSGGIDGYSSNNLFITRGSITAGVDLATLRSGSYWIQENTGSLNPTPTTYSALVVLGNSYYSPQLSTKYDASKAWLRGIVNSGTHLDASDWHELAFTDSNVASATNADMLDGVHLANGTRIYNTVPYVDNSGVMEIGKYIDFHDTDNEANDYSTRIKCAGSYDNVVSLPSTTGTLALTTDNVASATKLQTARTIWGQSFDGTGNVSGKLSEVGDIIGRGVIAITSIGIGNTLRLKYNNDNTKSVVLDASSFKPYDEAANLLDLGTSSARWKGIYGNTLNLEYSSTNLITLKRTVNDGGAFIDYFANNQSSKYWRVGGNNSYGFAFTTNQGSGQFTPVTISASGDFGIGTTTPAHKLDVNGDISGDFVDWYGVSWSENDSDPTCTRIGNMAMHKSLPIQSAMKGYVINNSSGDELIAPIRNDWRAVEFNFLNNNQSDVAFTSSNAQVMIKIPEFWYIDDYDGVTKTHNLKISQTAKAGWCHHKEAYVGAYEGYNDGTYYRSTKNVIPTTSLSRTKLRSLARANGYEGESKWNIYTYEEHRAICHLFLVEYATRNCQLAVDTALTADGFKQGGLGSGCTGGSVTVNGVTTHSFIPTGTTDSLGNGSGQVSYTVTQTDASGNEISTVTRYTNRYRGIENPFGHIWKHCDDVISQYANTYRTWYKCEKPESFATNKNSKYKPICSRAIPLNGYKKEIAVTTNCDFFAESTGGSESTYWCDYNYDNTDTSEHCLLIGGDSGDGGRAGLFYLYSDYAVGSSAISVGSRLTYLPWAE